VKAFPKLHALIQECWKVRRKERPNFDEIVSRLQGDIGDEIKRKEEPKIELYSKEDDGIYRGRIGKEDEIEDSDGEDAGEGTKRGGAASEAAHKAALGEVLAEMGRLREKHARDMKEAQRGLVSRHDYDGVVRQLRALQEENERLLEGAEGRGGEDDDGKEEDVDAEIARLLSQAGPPKDSSLPADEDVDAELRRLLGK
jgi:hypothetical protein